MRWLNRALVAALGFGLLVLAVPGAQAGRSIRVDLDDTRFDTDGETWSSVNQFFAGTTLVTGSMPFALNFSGAAGPGDIYGYQYQAFPVGDPVISAFNSTSPFNLFILPFFLNKPGFVLEQGDISIGKITSTKPYSLDDAVDAIRFTWTGTASDGEFVAAQVVLLNRAADGSPGDFDVELNYGLGAFAFPAGGSQVLGANPSQFFDSAGAYAYDGFCFRDGIGEPCSPSVVSDPPDPPPPPEVPEPPAYALIGLGLLAMRLRRQKPA